VAVFLADHHDDDREAGDTCLTALCERAIDRHDPFRLLSD
jgi:hypothetical protein